MKKHDPYRSAYQKLYYKCKTVDYWHDPRAQTLTWKDYLKLRVDELRASFSVEHGPRGPYKDHSTFTDRQKYQVRYQRARRVAMEFFDKSPNLRTQYNQDFAAYWKATKNTYLPGFFQRQQGLKRVYNDNAKDRKSSYRTAYTEHRRKWEYNDADVWTRFGTWKKYWEFVKANAFTSPDHPPKAEFPDAITYMEGAKGGSPLDGGVYFSYVPATPEQRMPPAAFVQLHDDPEPDNQPWLRAA